MKVLQTIRKFQFDIAYRTVQKYLRLDGRNVDDAGDIVAIAYIAWRTKVYKRTDRAGQKYTQRSAIQYAMNRYRWECARDHDWQKGKNAAQRKLVFNRKALAAQNRDVYMPVQLLDLPSKYVEIGRLLVARYTVAQIAYTLSISTSSVNRRIRSLRNYLKRMDREPKAPDRLPTNLLPLVEEYARPCHYVVDNSPIGPYREPRRDDVDSCPKQAWPNGTMYRQWSKLQGKPNFDNPMEEAWNYKPSKERSYDEGKYIGAVSAFESLQRVQASLKAPIVAEYAVDTLKAPTEDRLPMASFAQSVPSNYIVVQVENGKLLPMAPPVVQPREYKLSLLTELYLKAKPWIV